MSPPINQKLIGDLKKNLGLRRAAIYRRIARVATQLAVSNDVAALAVAQDADLTINRYGTPEQLTALREARRHQPALAAPIVPSRSSPARSTARKKVKQPSKNVFVVHGRNNAVRKSMFEFLRAIGLNPLEWGAVMRATRKGAPYIGEALEAAFRRATAVVVLLTPDDEAQLKKEFWGRDDEVYERQLLGQARPNVLFEAGMAFGHHPRATVLVEVGRCRPFSDIFGRHVVKLDNSVDRRRELADKLATVGCPVTLEGQQWVEAGNFEPLRSRKGR